MIRLPGRFHARPVRILLAGCGGTGSHMLSGLARLDSCLRGLGHPGLEVAACDPDRVSETNVGRQLFAPGDVGLAKADVLIHRANLWFGLDWQSQPIALTAETRLAHSPDLLIGCVDSAAARHGLAELARTARIPYWLDCGNGDTWGQVVLGQPVELPRIDPDAADAPRLPTVVEMFPDMDDSDDTAPSCSLAESLGRQGAFINQMIASIALDQLYQILRTGRITRFAWFFSGRDGRMTALPATPETLARYARRASAA